MMLGTTGLFASLAVLALIDATSIGTLVIPVWLVLRAKKHRDLRAAVAYLAVIGVFYLCIGLALLSGASAINDAIADSFAQSPIVRWMMLLLGGGMLAWAISRSPKKKKNPTGVGVTVPSSEGTNGSSRLSKAGQSGASTEHTPITEGRWAARLDMALGSSWGIIALGLTAGLLELPTMLPYLGAIGLLTQSSYEWAAQAGLLGAYCLLMLIPGFIVIGVRAVAGARLQKTFEKISAWLSRASGETLLWIVGIAGFLMLRSSLTFLFPDASWNPFS